MWTILFPVICSSYTITQFPESGPPPEPRILVASAYDSISNQIIFLGGEGLKGPDDLSSTLYAYNLNTFTWITIPSKMGFVPQGLKDAKIYFRKLDHKVFVFGGQTNKGLNTVVYSFDLKRYFWNIEIMSGDVMASTIAAAFTQFSFKGIEYIAIHGGYSGEGLIDDFYLIETDQMKVRKIPRNGNHPGHRFLSWNFFHNETYYMLGVDATRSNFQLYKFDLSQEIWSFVETYGQMPPELTVHEVFVRDDSFYLINGVISKILLPHLFYYRFDFLTSTWVKLNSIQKVSDWTYYHSVIDVNGKIYKAFGTTITAFQNSITMIELGDEIKSTIISQQYISPEPRRNHLTFMSKQNMYIYGGKTDEGVFLKDLWKFNFVNKVWSKVEYSGSPPLYRENMASTTVFDIGLVVFGGQSGEDYYNDFFLYEEKNSIWFKYTGGDVSPNPRFGSCIVQNRQKFFVIGGQNNQFAFSDIYMYDRLENSFTLLEDNLPFSLAFHKCWAIVKENELNIYVMGGRTFNGETLKAIHLITVGVYSDAEYKVKKTEIILNDYYLNLYYTALVVSGNTAHLMIGAPFEGIVNATLASYDMCENKLTYTNFPMEYGVFGHTAVHYGKSIYVFGGGYTIHTRTIHNSASNRLFNFSLPEVLNCSLGLYEEESECKSCPAGTFGEFSSPCDIDEFCYVCPVTKNSCFGCNAGQYSNSRGSAYRFTCSLCPQGKFSNQFGSTYCRDCTQSGFCPLGSSKPIKNKDKYEFSSVQPAEFKTQQEFASLFINNLWYSVIFVMFVLFLIFVIFPQVRKKMLEIDLYTDGHPQELEVPVIHRKTMYGGFFSIIFYIFVVAILISAYITYTYDNIFETRTLVPLVTVHESSEAEDFIVYTQFHVYGGECIGSGKGNCHFELIIDDTGLNYKNRVVECKLVEKTCLVKMTYQNIKTTGDFEIYYKMKEFLSFANLITVNVSVSTGIPDENSRNFIPIYASPDEFMFRGTSPTVLIFEFIPTFFKSESSKWPSSAKGFHLRYDQNPQLGSMIDSEQLYTTAYVYLKLEFKISNTALNIFRELRTSLYLLFSGLLGMIAGVLESVGTVMGYVEDTAEGLKSKLKKKSKFNNLIHKREKFNDFFINDEETNSISLDSQFPKPKCNEFSRSLSFTIGNRSYN